MRVHPDHARDVAGYGRIVYLGPDAEPRHGRRGRQGAGDAAPELEQAAGNEPALWQKAELRSNDQIVHRRFCTAGLRRVTDEGLPGHRRPEDLCGYERHRMASTSASMFFILS